MPYGIQRLNVKRSQPNPNIVFIKPLAGPDEKIAQDFLERIAAQCLPVMREHTLSVMSLEEFPPNREFVGRNFNAGEVIQLVLKSPSTGRWLPFEYVQMVMMHELAHCKQMNHSRAFWAVRNQYATQMYGLWSKGYTGDGLWGRGARLATGEWENNKVLADEVLPEHLCGGTYRSRGRKRKAKPTLTYQEKKERRILKKFGRNGMALGADDDTKVKLEKGKKVQGKPRVAGSARGRELRAAAALARFEQAKPEPDVKDEDATESGSESEFEDADLDFKDALDLDGSRLVDEKGRGMIRICEDEAQDDPGALDETKELQNVLRGKIKTEPIEINDDDESTHSKSTSQGAESSGSRRPRNLYDIPAAPARITHPKAPRKSKDKPRAAMERQATVETASGIIETPASGGSTPDVVAAECGICTFANAPSAAKGFINAGDCGVCALCGKKRP
ncbi:WLM domain-containing protein [Sarocladium implicatum]|nr:WLM domain-containing protein [Sarocladium implicatum]